MANEMSFRKMTLNINGAERTFICNPSEDTLATVLRRLGLTGVKIGCGTGVCGACSVILDNKVIRSCTKKVSKLKEYSTVTTIEGIGSPNFLHPLQIAFINKGAVQCGFCTPGFIVSAYQLLKNNMNPTREEIRDWFQKNRNICRCTGYKQIVDAVMVAAEVIRGEKSLEEIKFKDPEDGNYYGKPVPRPAALAKVCGTADYGDDIELKMPDNTLHVVMVQPKLTHHATVKKIHTEEASKMPGVYKVITAKDILELGGSNRLMFYTFSPRSLPSQPVHKLLVEDKIHTYGDIIALVVANTKAEAIKAAEKVTMEYEELPAMLNYLEAAMPDAPRIYSDHPNVWGMQPTIKGEGINVPALIKNAPNVVEGSFYSTREPHMPIEGDTVQAYWDEDGMLTVHCKAMAIYANIGDIAESTGIPEEKVRVVQNPTGGTFGWGIAGATYSLAACACIICDNRPVAFSMTYEEFMSFSGKRSPSYVNSKLACDKEGKIIAAEWDAGFDHGAYIELGDDIITRLSRFIYFPYNIPNSLGLSRVAVTNHAYGTAYRGYGSPQAYTASEAMMDIMAEKMNMDPFDFRRLNIARPGDTNNAQFEYNIYPMDKIMDQMEPIYRRAKKAANEFNKNPKKNIKKGVGIAWGGYNVTEGTEDQCTVSLELTPENKFIKRDTWQDVGQGGDIGSLMVTLESLRIVFKDKKRIKRDDIILIQNDSKFCPDHGASASSRSHFMNGISTKQCAEKLYEAMRKADGTLRTYEEMVADKIPTIYENQFLNKSFSNLMAIDPNTGKANPTPDYTYALFLAEVEVNTDTGKTVVKKYHCVDDVGVIGNIDAVNGQAYGGISHSIGFALSENYDDVKKHNNIAGAGIPSILDIPDEIEIYHLTTKRETNPFGSSGASEAYQSSGHMAVINAIYDAVGVRVYELPATAEKVKAGLELINKGENLEKPKKYFLGSDFYETMEDIYNNPV